MAIVLLTMPSPLLPASQPVGATIQDIMNKLNSIEGKINTLMVALNRITPVRPEIERLLEEGFERRRIRKERKEEAIRRAQEAEAAQEREKEEARKQLDNLPGLPPGFDYSKVIVMRDAPQEEK